MAQDFKLLSGLKTPYREYGSAFGDRVIQPRNRGGQSFSATRTGNIVNKPAVGFNVQAAEPPSQPAPTFNGAPKARPVAIKTAASALRGKPKTASMVKQSTRNVPLMSSTPPMPRAKAAKASPPVSKPSLKFRIQAALRTGKDNQELAKKRMLARTHRG